MSDHIETYQEALERLGGRPRQKIANNTYLTHVNRPALPNAITVRLHNTDVLTYHIDGRVVYNTGGWKTVTTKDRLNRFGPSDVSVYSDQGVWYLHQYRRDHRWPFADEITIEADGNVTGQGEDPKAQLRLRRRVQKFASDYIKALQAGEVPRPGNGDCWYCVMRTQDGTTLGEKSKGSDHILSHLEEKYYVPSLLVRALEVMPCSPMMRWAVGTIWYPEDRGGRPYFYQQFVWQEIQKALSRYIFRQLGQAA